MYNGGKGSKIKEKRFDTLENWFIIEGYNEGKLLCIC